ncbi:MAG TPA: RagB/SusD family nutrient uptake outer membrane protein [Bacteroidales bacterium]|nr:RagB/SusD family nutrient uptake outer membrane protein [Bacteroidales bacterium]
MQPFVAIPAYTIRVFFLAFLLIVTSCERFYREDISTLLTPESNALNNETGLTAALAGAYKPMGQFFTQGYANASTAAVLMGGDDLTTHKASNKADFREFDQFVVSNTNQRLPFIWKGAYKSIQQCNNIISSYTGATGNQAIINQIAGEAYFLRAYNYFWIVRLWGNAPLVLNSNVFDESLLHINTSSVREIYDQIIADLKAAEMLTGNKKPAPGRVCLGTVKAVLAEVYLQMTGYPLNDVSKYALAAAKAKEVIDNEAIYGLGLMDDFKALWVSPGVNNDGNKEEVFALNFLGSAVASANGWVGIAARPGEEGGWDDYMCELTFFREFPEGYRKNVTFQTKGLNSKGEVIPYTLFQTKRPYYKKLQGNALTQLNAISLPLERLAETYLIFAEAQVMSTGNPKDPLALEAFNMIKRRGAGLPLNLPDVNIDATSLTQREIITEKGWEFAGEFCRWFDLVRLQMVTEVVNKKDPDELPPLGPVKYFLPLPNTETDVNPNLLN